jgi:hypothetical protein
VDIACQGLMHEVEHERRSGQRQRGKNQAPQANDRINGYIEGGIQMTCSGSLILCKMHMQYRVAHTFLLTD